jgi:hypothetical protein
VTPKTTAEDPIVSYPDNTPSIDALINLPAGEIAQLPVELIAALQSALDHAASQLKAANSRFSTALEVRYATRAAEARRACGKDTGTVRLVDGDYTVVADLPKKVEWDQAQLAVMAQRIVASGEDPAEYIDTSMKVSERRYGALPLSWRKGFEPARTVSHGKPSFKLEPTESP